MVSRLIQHTPRSRKSRIELQTHIISYMYVVYRGQSVGSLHKHSCEMEIETISAKHESLCEGSAAITKLLGI